MKLILLAATALIATPVIAQDTTAGAPTTQTAPATPAMDPAAPATPATDPAMTTQDPAAAPMPQTPPATGTDPAAATPPAGDMNQGATPPAGGMAGSTASPAGMTTGDPVGGYQPAPNAGPAGMPRTVAEAFPAPAPLASYPICKKGQYDKCRQRGGK